jgi:hypothetical protein
VAGTVYEKCLFENQFEALKDLQTVYIHSETGRKNERGRRIVQNDYEAIYGIPNTMSDASLVPGTLHSVILWPINQVN